MTINTLHNQMAKQWSRKKNPVKSTTCNVTYYYAASPGGSVGSYPANRLLYMLQSGKDKLPLLLLIDNSSVGGALLVNTYLYPVIHTVQYLPPPAWPDFPERLTVSATLPPFSNHPFSMWASWMSGLICKQRIYQFISYTVCNKLLLNLQEYNISLYVSRVTASSPTCLYTRWTKNRQTAAIEFWQLGSFHCYNWLLWSIKYLCLSSP